MARGLLLAGALLAGGTLVSAELSPIVPFVIPSGRPTADEVRGIVDNLQSAGFDQFMVYPSTGVDYEYLGEAFFAMMGTFVDEAAKRGMKLWLYDEFNWPSGTARGRVPAENEACLYRELVAVTNAAGMRWETVVSREINVDNYCLDGNNFEPASVRRFMELTHRAYEKRFGAAFGSTIRGVFTDEPGHCTGAWRLKMPAGTVLRLPQWSGMEEEYRAASGGRDFRADFERAFRDGTPAQADVLRRWTELRSRRYRKTYFDPIADWCSRAGLEFCGHLVGEDSPGFCARINGLPLHTVDGLTKPGIDLIMSMTDRGFEWLTLAFVQSAALRKGKPGVSELFGLGPCDLTFAIMRKLYWLSALHKVDTFFQGLYHYRAFRFEIKDSWAMFTSPTQPWFDEMPLLHETAKEAARWARKPFRCDIAVIYPQREVGACEILRTPAPDLPNLCRELTWRQLTYRLVEEDESTDGMSAVLDWEGTRLCDRVSGTRFDNVAAAAVWLDAKFAARARVKDETGATRGGFVTRAYEDGSAVAVDILSGEVIVASDGQLSPRAETAGAVRPVADRWALSLSGPSKRRTWFWTRKAEAQRATDDWLKREEKVEETPRYEKDNVAKVVLPNSLAGVRFALRAYPTNTCFAVTLDGRPLAFPNPCRSVDAAFDPLYRETDPIDLPAGTHVFDLSGGKDGKLFLPVMWMIGEFAEKEYGVLAPRPETVRSGSLAELGLGSFAGVATYRAEASFAAGERLRVDSGGAVVRVRFGGRDLGSRGWAPFEWTIPGDLAGRRLPLEIDIVTSVRPIFGSERAPDAKLDHALWVSPSLEDPSPVGLRSAEAVKEPSSSADVLDLQVYSSTMKKNVPVGVILPKGYLDNPTKRYPVIYALHGANGSWETFVRDNGGGLADEMRRLSDAYGFIVVSPDGDRTSWWWDSPIDSSFRYETFVSQELVPWVDANFRTNTNRLNRAVIGASMGGHGACWIGFRHKDLFSVVGNVFGGVDIRPFPNNWDIGKRLGKLEGNEDVWTKYSAITEAAKLKDGDIRLVSVVGTEDFFLEANRRMHALLTSNKVGHTYVECRAETDETSGHHRQFLVKALPLVFNFIDGWFSAEP